MVFNITVETGFFLNKNRKQFPRGGKEIVFLWVIIVLNCGFSFGGQFRLSCRNATLWVY